MSGVRRKLPWLGSALLAMLSLGVAARVRAHVALEASLDVAQEVPAPTVSGNPTGSFVGLFDPEGLTLEYRIDLTGLSGAPIGAHLHEAPVGMPGNISVVLDHGSFDGSRVSGTAQGDASPNTLGDTGRVESLYAGGMYVNVHTAANPLGEIRGQIRLAPGRCNCGTQSRREFKNCVRTEVRNAIGEAVDNATTGSERRAAKRALKRELRPLQKAANRSHCGRSRNPRRAIACCLPRVPQENIVTERICAPLKERACERQGGVNAGASCFEGDPCNGSPSGAFLADPGASVL